MLGKYLSGATVAAVATAVTVAVGVGLIRRPVTVRSGYVAHLSSALPWQAPRRLLAGTHTRNYLLDSVVFVPLGPQVCDISAEVPTLDKIAVKIFAQLEFQISVEDSAAFLGRHGPDYIETMLRPLAVSVLREIVATLRVVQLLQLSTVLFSSAFHDLLVKRSDKYDIRIIGASVSRAEVDDDLRKEIVRQLYEISSEMQHTVPEGYCAILLEPFGEHQPQLFSTGSTLAFRPGLQQLVELELAPQIAVFPFSVQASDGKKLALDIELRHEPIAEQLLGVYAQYGSYAYFVQKTVWRHVTEMAKGILETYSSADVLEGSPKETLRAAVLADLRDVAPFRSQLVVHDVALARSAIQEPDAA